MDKIFKERLIDIEENCVTKIQDILLILEKVYNAEIETVQNLCDLSSKYKNIILTCMNIDLLFLSSDDRLLMTEYGQICFLKLHQKYNI